MGLKGLPGIKQDINFLEYPLWFLNLKHDGKGFVWNDLEGYVYRSGYTPPDKTDILILLSLLQKSQQRGYQSLISCTKYDILKSCDLPTTTFYYARLKESLLRWANVAIHFEGTFYDGKKYDSMTFHIMNEKIDAENGHIVVRLDPDWLLKIKESQYFKYINFELYKSLKRPVSRRLHEWLCKSFIKRDICWIGLQKLGKKLTIQGRETKKGKVVYASDVLTAIKPAINEINRLSRDPDILNRTGIKPKELFTITYEISGEKQARVITFHRHPVPSVTTKKATALLEEEPQITTLLKLLKKRTEKLEEVIKEYYQTKGYEYVKASIEYANAHAKKSYSTYLQKTLKKNWAEEWAEEEQEKEAEKTKQEEQKRKKAEELRQREQEQKETKREKPKYLEKVARLKQSIKRKLWKQAASKVAPDHFNRESMIKLEYNGLLWQYLNSHGESFCKGIAKDFRIGLSLEKPI